MLPAMYARLSMCERICFCFCRVSQLPCALRGFCCLCHLPDHSIAVCVMESLKVSAAAAEVEKSFHTCLDSRLQTGLLEQIDQTCIIVTSQPQVVVGCKLDLFLGFIERVSRVVGSCRSSGRRCARCSFVQTRKQTEVTGLGCACSCHDFGSTCQSMAGKREASCWPAAWWPSASEASHKSLSGPWTSSTLCFLSVASVRQ